MRHNRRWARSTRADEVFVLKKHAETFAIRHLVTNGFLWTWGIKCLFRGFQYIGVSLDLSDCGMHKAPEEAVNSGSHEEEPYVCGVAEMTTPHYSSTATSVVLFAHNKITLYAMGRLSFIVLYTRRWATFGPFQHEAYLLACCSV